jgi:DNA-binding transcriptional MerR regulator
MENKELSVSQTAAIVGVHRNTVLRYEKRGVIVSQRDHNGFRKYPLEEALKIKKIFSLRK